MNRTRLSATVDARLLDSARRARAGTTDAALVDEAVTALLARHRSAEVDAGYAGYDEHPAGGAGRVGGPGVVPKGSRSLLAA
jgi:hypothetical protein